MVSLEVSGSKTVERELTELQQFQKIELIKGRKKALITAVVMAVLLAAVITVAVVAGTTGAMGGVVTAIIVGELGGIFTLACNLATWSWLIDIHIDLKALK